MKQKFKKAALTAAVAATTVGGMGMIGASSADAAVVNSLRGTCASSGSLMNARYTTTGGATVTKGFGSYGCERTFVAYNTGNYKISVDASTGAMGKSAKKGYVRWSVRNAKGASVCGGYIHPNSKTQSFNCKLSKGNYKLWMGDLANNGKKSSMWYGIN